MTRIVAIESSCDETAFALATPEGVVAHTVYSQIATHQKYGGVIPEVAARMHLEKLPLLYEETIKPLVDKVPPTHIAVTIGPGLVGGLLTGMAFAEGLSLGFHVPVIGINHLEGHALSPMLRNGTDHAFVPNDQEESTFPYLLVLVSGGHCAFIDVARVGKYTMIAQTRDDAIGEAFDKTARLIGLPYPGGPAIQQVTQHLSPAQRTRAIERFPLPEPMAHVASAEMSFSGFKSAVQRLIMQNNWRFDEEACEADPSRRELQTMLAASIEHHLVSSLVNKVRRASTIWRATYPSQPLKVVIAGGVGANAYLRTCMATWAETLEATVTFAPLALCTDNAAMIAWAAVCRVEAGLPLNAPLRVRPRWPIEQC
ncbi:MAG: tRNA (adenosine(37)-N6)-threonylcarbamoyltransferase complex transferase subunit TsaD [Alphaproteobacteria bacterium]|nr:tRNA (adenosine(37)-N6)-threonylcarbamoyltransferase complex transferase subunit TsaD [Alphaproteobacteria bacterium]